MPKNANSTSTPSSDPDDAPAWTAEVFERAEHRRGDALVRPASGTLTRRGRPPLAQPKKQVTLRLDQDVLDWFRAQGSGWQSRINEALRKAAKV